MPDSLVDLESRRAAVQSQIAQLGSAIFEPLIESGKVNELADQKQIAGLKAGLEIPAKDYLKAMRVRTLVQKEVRKLFTQVDVLLAPSRFGPASKISDPLDRRSSDRPLPNAGTGRADSRRQSRRAAGALAALRLRR
jgi:Asp-tRNA(Asn)/Glu-tRNA(Gln) amidotransferase A subunit family amidase